MASRTVSMAAEYAAGVHVWCHSPVLNEPLATAGRSSEYATFGSGQGSGAEGAEAP